MKKLTKQAIQVAEAYYTKALPDYAGRAEILTSPSVISIQTIINDVRKFATHFPVPSGEAEFIATLERDHSLEMFELRSKILQTITEHEDAVRRLAETLLSEKHRQVLAEADRAKKRGQGD